MRPQCVPQEPVGGDRRPTSPRRARGRQLGSRDDHRGSLHDVLTAHRAGQAVPRALRGRGDQVAPGARLHTARGAPRGSQSAAVHRHVPPRADPGLRERGRGWRGRCLAKPRHAAPSRHRHRATLREAGGAPQRGLGHRRAWYDIQIRAQRAHSGRVPNTGRDARGHHGKRLALSPRGSCQPLRRRHLGTQHQTALADWRKTIRAYFHRRAPVHNALPGSREALRRVCRN